MEGKWKKRRKRKNKKTNCRVRERQGKKGGYKEMKWWKKSTKLAESFLSRGVKQNKEKEARKRRRRPKLRWTLGEFGRWLLFLIMIGPNLLGLMLRESNPRKQGKDCPSMGKCARKNECFLCILLALGRLDPEE